MPMNIYNTSVGGMATGTYRGNTASSPMSPFSFQSPSVMQSGSNPLRQHPIGMQQSRFENRAASTPSLPTLQQLGAGTSSRPRPSVGTSSNTNALGPLQHSISNDGSSPSRSIATLDLNVPSTQQNSYANVAKSAPDRYKRNHRRAETAGGLPSTTAQSGSAMPSGSGMANVGHLYSHPNQTSSSPALSTYPTYRGAPSPNAGSPQQNFGSHRRLSSQDDMNVQQRQPSTDLAKRYRRRSISSLEAKEFTATASELATQPTKPKTYAAMLASPAPTERKEPRGPARLERTAVEGRRDSSESGSVSSSANSSSVWPSTMSVLK